jgi:DNA-binding CsgD family transcriptional regulator
LRIATFVIRCAAVRHDDYSQPVTDFQIAPVTKKLLFSVPVRSVAVDTSSVLAGEPADPSAGGGLPDEAGTAIPFDHQLKVVYETAFDGLFIVDDGRRYLRINEPAAKLLGAPADQILTSRIEDFTPPELWPALERLWAAFKRDGKLQGPYEVLRGDGDRSYVEFQAAWNFDSGQHLIAAREMNPPWSKTGANSPMDDGPQLTSRECEVIQLAAEGKSTREIAVALFLSPGTVKTHLHNVYEKLGARDRAAAVAACIRRGLIE